MGKSLKKLERALKRSRRKVSPKMSEVGEILKSFYLPEIKKQMLDSQVLGNLLRNGDQREVNFTGIGSMGISSAEGLQGLCGLQSEPTQVKP